MQVWNVLHTARWKYRTQQVAQNSPSGQRCTTLSKLLGCIFAIKACIDNWKKLVKQQYLFQTSSHYGEIWPISSWGQFTSLGTPANFNGFDVLASLLPWRRSTDVNHCQPNFARCLAVSLAGTLYILFLGLLPLREFCQVQNSVCVQDLGSPILAALLHSIWAVSVSQTLLCGTRNGIKELL